MKKLAALISLVFLLLASGSQVFAHKVRVFAYAEGDNIVGETGFNGGRSPRNAEIIVENDADGSTLLTAGTDEQGTFSFPIPEEARSKQLDLRIVVNVGEGHRNSWLLKAAEYLPEVTAKNPPTDTEKAQNLQSTGPQAQATAELGVDEETLRRIVSESVEQQLRPIKHMLAENKEKKIALQDILGGIGYILGLAGIAAYIQSKKGDKV